jgi:hypothetical protein
LQIADFRCKGKFRRWEFAFCNLQYFPTSP